MHKEFLPVSDDARKSLERLEAASASFAAMQVCGLSRVYRSRKDAVADIVGALEAPGVRNIRLIGVSLNDFVLESGELGRVFRNIQNRLDEQKPDGENRLDVKVLIVDPFSYGAQQRHNAETQTSRDRARLLGEVKAAATQLSRFKDRLRVLRCEGGSDDKSGTTKRQADCGFDCHLYRTAPQMFLVWTDHSCFLEHYYFWTSRDAQEFVPVLRYRPSPSSAANEPGAPANMHSEMEKHFSWVWHHASVPVEDFVPNDHTRFDLFGFDMGLCQAGAINVFMKGSESGNRIVDLLKTIREDAKCSDGEKGVDLMGISLRSFFELRPGDEGRIAREFARYALNRRGVTVRILCLDPDCEQAMIRSFRENQLERPDSRFEDYKAKPEQHRGSLLYTDTTKTKKHLERLTLVQKAAADNRGEPEDNPEIGTTYRCDLKAWQYACAPCCFMLRVGDTVLFEPYSYGKLDLSSRAPMLGGDMPVFEFQRTEPCLNLYEKIPSVSGDFSRTILILSAPFLSRSRLERATKLLANPPPEDRRSKSFALSRLAIYTQPVMCLHPHEETMSPADTVVSILDLDPSEVEKRTEENRKPNYGFVLVAGRGMDGDAGT